MTEFIVPRKMGCGVLIILYDVYVCVHGDAAIYRATQDGGVGGQ